MKYARIDNSPRLQRLAEYLADGRWHTTLDIVAGAMVCAVNSAVAELRANGIPVACRRQRDLWYYRREDVPPYETLA